MSQTVKTSTRMSAGLAAFIRGLSDNENAATRALLLIGADQLGVDPTLVADDLRVTITARLPAEVYAILLGMWNRVDHSAALAATPPRTEGRSGRDRAAAEARAEPTSPAPPAPPAREEPAPPTPEPLDPFSNVGFDFDEGE
jgi:hypothetical protein